MYTVKHMAQSPVWLAPYIYKHTVVTVTHSLTQTHRERSIQAFAVAGYSSNFAIKRKRIEKEREREREREAVENQRTELNDRALKWGKKWQEWLPSEVETYTIIQYKRASPEWPDWCSLFSSCPVSSLLVSLLFMRMSEWVTSSNSSRFTLL